MSRYACRQRTTYWRWAENSCSQAQFCIAASRSRFLFANLMLFANKNGEGDDRITKDEF